jgi:hypothetical protein
VNQIDTVLNHLTTRGPLSAKEAMEFYGIMRLGARIYDLKCAGFAIKKEMVGGKNRYGDPVRYAKYSLQKGSEQS